MNTDYVNKTIHTAKLSPEHRERLEALRDEVSTSRWRMSEEVYELREEYRRKRLDFPRLEVADACGVLPWDVDEMLLTVERVGWLAETSDLDVCYNAWKYIARHEDPQDFLSHLLCSMDDYGGRFPPVSVIRMKLAESKGNPPPDKPREWVGKVYRLDAYEDIHIYQITIEVDANGPPLPPPGTPVTLTEARDAAGRATRTATEAGDA